jgi:hypothetical protein
MLGRASIQLRAVVAAFALIGALIAAAGTATASTPHDLTGTWSCCGPGGAGSQTWTITAMDKSSGVFSGTGKGGCCTFPVKGTATGDSVTLTTGPYEPLTSYTATFTGTLSADSKTLTGSWKDNGAGKGTFTATRPTAPDPGDPGGGSPDTPTTGGNAKVKVVPGDIYVSDSSANVGSGAVYRVNPENGSTVLIHQGAPFSAIRDIAFGPEGNLYVADMGASAIHKIDLKTGAVTRLTAPFDSLLRNPWGIVYDPTFGDFLVTDRFFGTVVRVDPKTGVVKPLADGLKQPHSIALAPGLGPFVTDLRTPGVFRIEQGAGGWKAKLFKKAPFVALTGIAIGVTPAGYRFFVSDSVPYTQAGGVCSWVDNGKPEVLASNSVIGTPAGVGLSSDGRTLYIGSTGTSAGTGSIIEMNLADKKLKTLAGGFVSPVSFAVAPPKQVAVSVSTSGPGTNATTTGVTTAVTSPQQPVLASVAVSVNVPAGFGAHASKAIRVKPVQASIPPGKRTKVKVRFPRSLTKQIKGALKAGRKVKAKVTVTASAANGSSRMAVKRVQIKSGG